MMLFIYFILKVGTPKEEDLANWGHHLSTTSVPDSVLQASAGDEVREEFLFYIMICFLIVNFLSRMQYNEVVLSCCFIHTPQGNRNLNYRDAVDISLFFQSFLVSSSSLLIWFPFCILLLFNSFFNVSVILLPYNVSVILGIQTNY